MTATTPSGTLYLVPNTLDHGVDGPLPALDDTLPAGVLRHAARLSYWIVENAKTARSFLKRVDAIVPLVHPLQELSISQLPGPIKGQQRTSPGALHALLAPAMAGHDIGLLSEAGLPAVADPGAAVVQLAHARRITVTALPGPSSLLLALAASGLNGQGFSFVGYPPIDAAARAARIRELELQSRRDGMTRIMIETPYRNQALFGALMQHLHGSTRLCVSCGLTLGAGITQTRSVAEWGKEPLSLPGHIPAVFLVLGAPEA